MANLKEIRAKVASIKSTQKITRAMQMVAASKMRRAQERMAQGRPYAENMHRVIAHLVQANPEYKHRYMVERPVKRVCCLSALEQSLAFDLCDGFDNEALRCDSRA